MGTASQFLKDMFGARSEALVCIASYANEGKSFKPAEIYTRDPAEIERFLKKYDKAGRAVYFSVNTIKDGKTRSKENVAEITALHADLDFKGIVEARREIEAVLARLPLKASRIVFSGHGLHVYWWTSAPPELKDRIETTLKRLAWALAGDVAVCEVARVMRLPGSHNSKFDEWRRVVVVHKNDVVYELDDLEAWLAGIAAPLLQRKSGKGNGSAPPGDPFADIAGEQKRTDIDELWNELQYFGEGGGGNLHDTEMRIGASMLSRGEQVEDVVVYLRKQLEIRVPESATWNWEEHGDHKKSELWRIRYQCVSWFVKHPDVFGMQKDRPAWLLQNHRIKDLLKAEQEQPAKLLDRLFLEELRKRLVVPLDWIVKDFILAHALNGIFGDGGVGKDLVLQQLGMAMTCGAHWLGREVKQGRVLYFPVEDDLDELRRREDNITAHFKLEAAKKRGDYAPRSGEFLIVPMLGKDTVLAVYDSKLGRIRPTELFESVRQLVKEFCPDLMIVGNRVNIFGVNQNEDAQARQCIALLNSLCTEFGTGVIMPSHASIGGMLSGEGTSGSVQWSNGIRLRTYLRRIKTGKDEPEANPNQRELEVMKSNYSAKGELLELEWSEGVFKLSNIKMGMPTETRSTDEVRKDGDTASEQEFLRLLNISLAARSNVSAQISAPNNAPKVFSEDVSSRYRGKKGRIILKSAMERLIAKGVIRSVDYGPPSHLRSRLIVAEKTGTILPFKASNPPSNPPSNPKK